MDWTKVWWDIDGDNDSAADGAAMGDDDFAFTADKISLQIRLLCRHNNDDYI